MEAPYQASKAFEDETLRPLLAVSGSQEMAAA
jgi:hypothetical protein